MASGKYAAAPHEIGAVDQLRAIELAEKIGVSAVWLTTGGAGPDAMTIFAAAAARTERIGLGTAIVPTFPRHPIVLIQQAQVVAALAPGRLRLGVGPSHQPTIEGMYGIPFDRPLSHLREYVTILKSGLQSGKFDFAGDRYTVRGEVPAPPKVPILVSALRPASFRMAGEMTDGAISWICPLSYLREKALPALREGAASANRVAPPLIAHVFAAVHEDQNEVRTAARGRLAMYQRTPFYQMMFVEAGFTEAQETLSDAMIDAVVVGGNETVVADRLRQYIDAGMDELIVSVLVIGSNRRASLERTMRLLAAI